MTWGHFRSTSALFQDYFYSCYGYCSVIYCRVPLEAQSHMQSQALNPVCNIFDNGFQGFQGFSGSELVPTTVKSRYTSLNFFASRGTTFFMYLFYVFPIFCTCLLIFYPYETSPWFINKSASPLRLGHMMTTTCHMMTAIGHMMTTTCHMMTTIGHMMTTTCHMITTTCHMMTTIGHVTALVYMMRNNLYEYNPQEA